ncbi:MAG TPA: diphthine--ammonia ligase [Thermoplasmata archaeon]|nr:diphthine--ammonia ligase [Thermoplasmata archaeon]
MGATALVSGGKDSTYAAYLADTQGWSVDELLVLRPEDPDSLLFHTPNLDLVRLQAEAWKKGYREVVVPGSGEAPESLALETALRDAGDPIVAGAIASSYQWARLSRVTFALGRRLYVPLWGKDPVRVVREEIAAGLDIRLVQLAAEPLTEDLLGRRLDDPLLEEVRRRSREVRTVNAAGEGGEYETLVVDAPFFSRRIELVATARDSRGGRHRLDVRAACLVPKPTRLPPGGSP